MVSRFRNLLHHHTHSSNPGPISSFWAGCGAVRRCRFLELGGFDAAAYDRPSIEDIEFGLRLADAGGRILLDPSIQGTHHKRWTLWSMLVTDISQRAIPWSRLLLQRRHSPLSLNLDRTSRASGVLSVALVACVGFAIIFPPIGWGAVAAGGLLLVLNAPFYRLCLARGGVCFLMIAVPLHFLYFLYSSLTLGIMGIMHWLGVIRV